MSERYCPSWFYRLTRVAHAKIAAGVADNATLYQGAYASVATMVKVNPIPAQYKFGSKITCASSYEALCTGSEYF